MNKNFLLDENLTMAFKFNEFCRNNAEYKRIQDKYQEISRKKVLMMNLLQLLKIYCVNTEFNQQAEKLNENQKLMAYDLREQYLKYEAESNNLSNKMATIRERLTPKFIKLVMSNF